MALSESGLAAAGVSPGPMVVQGPNGVRMTVRPKPGSAPPVARSGGKQNLYVRPKGKK